MNKAYKMHIVQGPGYYSLFAFDLSIQQRECELFYYKIIGWFIETVAILWCGNNRSIYRQTFHAMHNCSVG